MPATPRGRYSPSPTCDLHLDASSVIGHDALRDGQAQAGPLPRRLGGEERIPDPRRDLLGNARSFVLELDLDLVARPPRADGQPAAAVHRVERVASRAPGRPGGAGPRSRVTSDSAPSSSVANRPGSVPRLVREQLDGLFDQPVEVGRRPAAARLAHELQEAAGDLLAAVGLLLDQPEVGREVGQLVAAGQGAPP